MIEVLLLFNILLRCLGETPDEFIDLSHYGIDIYGKPIAHNSRRYAANHGNAEERGPYLEGDLLIPVNSKNGIQSQSRRWPKGQIPFEIIGSFSKIVKLSKISEKFINIYRES